MHYWQANSNLYRLQQVQFETSASLFVTDMTRVGTQSVKLPCNVWCSRWNRSRLSMAKVFHCSDDFNNWVLLLDVSNDNLSFSNMNPHEECFIVSPSLNVLMLWVLTEYVNMHSTLSNSKNIRTQCCVKCRTGTSRPNISLSGDSSSLQPRKKSLLCGMSVSLSLRSKGSTGSRA